MYILKFREGCTFFHSGDGIPRYALLGHLKRDIKVQAWLDFVTPA
jgi:hypothetical protein